MEALDLALPRTTESLRRETACAQRLARQAGPLSDALHAAVPALEHDPRLRRAALDLRRRVHNSRPAQLPQDVVRSLSERLDDTAGRALAQWLDGMSELTTLRAQTDALYEEETAKATERLRCVLSERVFAQGLAQASPQLLNHLTSKPLEPHSKAARSVLGYVSRAAVKTSPFSRLTALALGGQDADGTGHSYVDQQHVHAWLDALARDERFADALYVEPNRSTRHVEGRLYLLTPTHGGPGDAAWRTDFLTDATRYGRLIGELASWPRMSIAEALARISGDDAFGGFLRLLDTGLLRLVLPWSPTEQRPLRSLAQSLEGLVDPVAHRTGALLDRLDEEAAGLHLLSGAERARTLDALADQIRSFPDDDPRPSVRYAVYEDAVSDVPLDLPAGPIQEDLAELGRIIRPYIFRSHLYDWLRDEFVARYGPGGHCPDMFAFLWAVASAPGFDGNLYRALQKDHAESGRPTDRAWLPVSAGSAPPTTAVLYQIAAGSAEDVRRGDHLVVVNQYNSGIGGLLARFRHGLDRLAPEKAGLTHQLRVWIADLFPHAAPHQVTLSGDVNGMHHAAEGVLPPIHWPGEPSHANEAPRGEAATAMRHCPVTDTLEFTDPAGMAVAPVYLGVVPQHLVPGVARLLLCLADPWVNGSRLCCTTNPVDTPPPPAGEDIEVIPRKTHQRLVLGRRTWRFAPDVLPAPAKGEAPSAFFRRVHEWRVGHGLPDEVFLSVEASSWPPVAVSSQGKPLWLSFRSPHAVWAAAHHVGRAKGAKAVRLSEACPDRTAYWLRDSGGRHRAAEHVSHFRWERPAPEGCRSGETEAQSTKAAP
ncbi:lantibiotic dehydratase [Streptomyces sp. NPDC019396]|uniref:lantibiotic dehydratase n=1 Tax=Streptomyces sp. NPDC019396 TaxID=3154687 RepID=UPI0033C52152